jgi:hypothetical protein
MKYARAAALGLLFVANAAMAGTPAPLVPPAGLYVEQDDAGNRFNPQNVTGGPYRGFAGNIGGTDTVDAFRFQWLGGNFNGYFFPDTSDGIVVAAGEEIFRELFAATNLGSPLPHTGSAGYDLWGPIDPGIYVFELSTFAGDPPFAFALLNPSNIPFDPALRIAAVPAAAVPEPGTWLLVLIGVLGLAIFRKRIHA